MLHLNAIKLKAMEYYKNEEDFKEKCGYEIDDNWYPRVTKIVGIKNKPALLFYYAEAASYRAAQAMTTKSAEEGTLIHETMEKIFVGESPYIDPSIKPAIEAYLAFREQNSIQIDPEYIEKRVVSHDHRYAGTMDALALIGGRFGVLDIKTSAAIYRDYSLQTSAYIAPLKKEIPELKTRWILRIDQQHSCLKCAAMMRPKGGREKIKKGRGGSCPNEEHEWSELQGIIELKEFYKWENDFRAFLSAKTLWEWENEYWLKRVGYLS